MSKSKAIVSGIIVFLVVLTLRRFVINFRGFITPGDFIHSLTLAHNILRGLNPYAGVESVPYPLPAGILAIPFSFLPNRLAGDLFISLSSGLLAGTMIWKTGQWWRLLLFFSVPFHNALEWTQWSPLVTTAWFIPALAPLLFFIKPQITIPVLLTKFRKAGKGYFIAILVVAASFIISPSWPIHWWKLAQNYDYNILLLMPAGFLILLAVFKLSDQRAQLLLLMTILPFRSQYDVLSLFIIPENPWQMIILVAITWLMPTDVWFWFFAALVFILISINYKNTRSIFLGAARKMGNLLTNKSIR